ncbi:P63C domain-containing protein [Hwangdonia lutea]|uniref:P63C domain-containing protein n=1 Tax=Hwangdonia lutea TaxID=3075823 RepID=A0AA97ELH6_9FLAO|nr:P63C domain-containing protein [Hwangdonia sp. SCSIO 19198]WOD43619.1 P63C domain-containing protein [Hwangdonia sp. SCSIO 19198]
MAKNNIPEVKYKGQIEIGEFSISCAVLDNGERILVDRSLASALGVKGSGAYWQKKKEQKGAMLPEYVSANYLTPFISEEVREKLSKPIVYKDSDGKLNEGVSATALVDICDIWQQADKKGALDNRSNAKIAAHNAYVIFKGFANVGITALVDEATGYQYDREKDELQKILKQYISEELLPWQKRFPDIFYKELFRLNGWNFTVNGIKKRPGVIGTWTKKLIYEELPKGVLDELESNVPKSESGNKTARLHQLLTDDIGNPHLTAQINQIVTLFQLSDDMAHMWSQFEKLKHRQSGQLELPFSFDDKGHTIEPIEENNLSDFNQKLVQGLNYNPKDEK